MPHFISVITQVLHWRQPVNICWIAVESLQTLSPKKSDLADQLPRLYLPSGYWSLLHSALIGTKKRGVMTHRCISGSRNQLQPLRPNICFATWQNFRIYIPFSPPVLHLLLLCHLVFPIQIMGLGFIFFSPSWTNKCWALWGTERGGSWCSAGIYYLQ